MSAGLTRTPVPFVDLPAQYRSLKEEIESAIKPLFESGSFIGGKAVRCFEESFASYLGASHCVTVSSGTAALHVALIACGIGAGDEVITAANSFIATAEAISFAGATPRFVDVKPDTANLDVDKLESAITSRTKAVIPVHLYGQPADMDPILAIARRHNLKVIEDACQAHGARYKERRAGTLGDVGCFSFYPGKNLGAAGDGGAIVTEDAEIAQQMALLRDHGARRKYEHEILGYNFRLDAIQAAVLDVKLKYLDRWNEARRWLADRYGGSLRGISGLSLPHEAPGCQSVFHLYVVRLADRDTVRRVLDKAGIETGMHYPIPIHLQKAYKDLGYKRGDFPMAEKLAHEILSLPMYAELSFEQQDRVVEVIAGCLKS